MREEIERIIDDLETKSQDHADFSKALWKAGDNPNAHYQEGQSIGIDYAIARLRELL